MKHLKALAAAAVLVAAPTSVIAAPLTLECSANKLEKEVGYPFEPGHKIETSKDPGISFFITLDIPNQKATSSGKQFLVTAEPNVLHLNYKMSNDKETRKVNIYIQRATLTFTKTDFNRWVTAGRHLRLNYTSSGVCKKTAAPTGNQI